MSLIVLVVCCQLFLLVEAAPALAQDTYCSRWNRTTNNPSVQRYAMSENVRQLDGTKVDQPCLLRQLDALVRWANRICSDGTLDDRPFAHALVTEAKKRCP